MCSCVCVCVRACVRACVQESARIWLFRFNVTPINQIIICFLPVENYRPVQQCRSGQLVRSGSTDHGRLQHVLQHLSLPHLQRWVPQVLSQHLLLRPAIEPESVSPAGPPSNIAPTNCQLKTHDTSSTLTEQSQQLPCQHRTKNVQQVTRTISAPSSSTPHKERTTSNTNNLSKMESSKCSESVTRLRCSSLRPQQLSWPCGKTNVRIRKVTACVPTALND